MEMEQDFYSDDDSFESGSLGSFSPIVPESQVKKPFQVDFIVLSLDDLQQRQQLVIDQVAGVLGCQESIAACLLRYFKWNQEKLIESYLENPLQVCDSAGVLLNDQKRPKLAQISGFCCDICCSDDPKLQTLALACQHRFCRNCFQEYLTRKITQEGESRNIQCPAQCHLKVDEFTVEMLVDQSVYLKYKTLLMRTFVDDSTFIKWCPAPNCEYAIECKVLPWQLKECVPTVQCTCGFSFCFGCLLADHQPCICSLVKLWLKKCQDDSETSNWISANTKECPKCISTIEKNGGCNHMTCKKCKYEFCWVCLGPWSEHGSQFYSCNRYEEKTSIDARDAQSKSRAALERYLHYYNRYANHEQSAKLDKELYDKTEKKMEQMQRTSDLSWIEVQYMKKAVHVLLMSRSTLKWTYSFAYYLARNNQTAMFEDNQRDLEMAVEHLSEMLETPIDLKKISETKQAVLDKTVYVDSRRQVLLTDTLQGLTEGRWAYNVDT